MNYRGYRLATRQRQQVTVITISPPDGEPLSEFIVASRFEPSTEVLKRAKTLVDEHLAKHPPEAAFSSHDGNRRGPPTLTRHSSDQA